DPEAVRRLRRAGRKRDVEHPNLRPGHGAGYPPDHQARARQYVSISIRLALLAALPSKLRGHARLRASIRRARCRRYDLADRRRGMAGPAETDESAGGVVAIVEA